MKNILIFVLGVIIIGVVIFGLKYQNSNNQVTDYNYNLTEFQEESIQDDMNTMDEISNNSSLPVSNQDRQEFNTYVSNQALISSDNSLKSAFEQSILATVEIYKSIHGNYGESSTQNICKGNDSAGSLVELLKKYSLVVDCSPSINFPGQTFTFTAKANASEGYFCSDQNGFAGIIKTYSTIRKGISCK